MADKQPSTGPAGLDAVLSLINQADLSVGEVGARQPLGPPQGFYEDQASFMAAGGRPRDPSFKPYVNGDEWQPAFRIPPEERDRLKARMNAAGLYGTAGYQSGSWTREDANAYQQVLEASNALGIADANVVIDNIAEEVRRGPRAQGPRAPLVSRISNPDDIRAVIRKSAYDLTGSRLSDEEEARLISMYQGTQGAADQAAYGAAGGAGGTVTEAASPQNFAAAQIERMRPGEVATHRHLEAFEKILQSMGTLAPETPTYAGEGLPKAGGEVL
jgi:hypothetical protein